MTAKTYDIVVDEGNGHRFKINNQPESTVRELGLLPGRRVTLDEARQQITDMGLRIARLTQHESSPTVKGTVEVQAIYDKEKGTITHVPLSDSTEVFSCVVDKKLGTVTRE